MQELLSTNDRADSATADAGTRTLEPAGCQEQSQGGNNLKRFALVFKDKYSSLAWVRTIKTFN
jgi:hypothetical protein